MKLLLNAGFGMPIPIEDRKLIRSLGFDGVRQDINLPGQAGPFIDELLSSGLSVLALVRDIEVGRAVAAIATDDVSIELGNEEDSKQSPSSYNQWLNAAYAAIRRVNPKVRIISAGITTPDQKRLEWLKGVFKLGVPEGLEVGLHTYRGHTKPDAPHKGFRNRADEFATIRSITGNRPLHITEVGWHTVETVVKQGFLGFGRKVVKWTDEDVKRFVTEEAKIALSEGVKTFTLFQLNDGPDPRFHEHHYGIRRVDGSLKPVAEVFK